MIGQSPIIISLIFSRGKDTEIMTAFFVSILVRSVKVYGTTFEILFEKRINR
jgi:hypothetical protein